MQYTNLELTKAILSSTDSDEINSINDTVESQQVVEIIKTVYDDIISRGGLQSNKVLFNLTPSNDVTKPVLMYRPDNIDRIEWIKYNNIQPNDNLWDEMQFLEPSDFIELTHELNTSDINVDTFEYIADGSVITFAYRNDLSPKYYTTLSDTVIIFDSFDNTVSSTLEASKTIAFGPRRTAFEYTDSFIPALQPNQFALLLSEAKSLAWVELKQTPNAKAEQTARRNWTHLQKTRVGIPSADNNFNSSPNFARRK